jgi:hypothetical protein
MTALKLLFAVGLLLGAGALAWSADSAAKAEAAARVKKAAALIKREVAAFAKFIGTDVSHAQNAGHEIKEQPAIAVKRSESWQETKITGAVRRSV